jgi:PQQ-like domain
VRRLVPAVLVAALALCAAAQASTTDPSAWTSYGYDNQLGNAVATGTLTLRAVPKLRLDWSRQLDGAVYASPLAANVGGRQLLFVATEGGTVYAIDAGTDQIVWQRSLGTIETNECGTWGFTSTGAIDLRRQVLFEAGADGRLHALDLATGDEAQGYPLTLVENSRYEYVWGGLRIANDRLYVVVASYCDAGAPGGPMPEGRLTRGSRPRATRTSALRRSCSIPTPARRSRPPTTRTGRCTCGTATAFRTAPCCGSRSGTGWQPSSVLRVGPRQSRWSTSRSR